MRQFSKATGPSESTQLDSDVGDAVQVSYTCPARPFAIHRSVSAIVPGGLDGPVPSVERPHR